MTSFGPAHPARSPTSRVLPLALLAGVLVAGVAARADTIQRCESADGKVTYSNTPCPNGTRQQRQVDAAPALEVVQPPSQSKGDTAGPDTKAPETKAPETKPAGTIERSKPKDARPVVATPAAQAKPVASAAPVAKPIPTPVPPTVKLTPPTAASAAATGRATQSAPSADQSRAEEIEKDLEKRQQQIGQCDDLTHQIEYAQHDFDSAAAGDKASAELTLRRLQAQHTAQCEAPVQHGTSAKKS